MGVKTRTGSQDGFKRAVLCTLCVSVGGDIRLNRLQNIVFYFYCNNAKDIVLYGTGNHWDQVAAEKEER